MVDRDSSAILIGFLQSYTKLMEEQLLNIRESMVTTVENVMKGVEQISHAADEKKQHAEKALESTFINPDAETEVLIQDLQRVVNDVFEETSQQMLKGGDLTDLNSSEPTVLVQNRIKRLHGKFQHDMSSLTELDDDLRNIVFSIIGSLSSEDVIAQKLDHIVMSMKALQTGLSYILIDYEYRCNKEELQHVIGDIKHFTYRQYTCEDEKERFALYLGDKKKAI